MKDGAVYEDMVDFKALKKYMEDQLEDYNMEPGVIAMDLVLFRDAIEHGKAVKEIAGFQVHRQCSLTSYDQAPLSLFICSQSSFHFKMKSIKDLLHLHSRD